MTPESWKLYNPVAGIRPLFEAAAELRGLDRDADMSTALVTGHKPLLLESLHTLECALNPLTTLPESRIDYGFIHCLVPHCLVISVEEDEVICYPQVAEDDNAILLSGWVTGLTLGCDFDEEVGAFTSIEDVYDGIWMSLAAEKPTEFQQYYDGAYVQIPHARLLNPTSLAN